MAIAFPTIDPVIFTVGPLQVRWYGMAYVTGLLITLYLGMYLLKKYPARLKPHDFDSMFIWGVIGLIAGARLGHVLIYEPAYYLAHPLEILYTWKGGMSFHGGVVGVALAIFLSTKKYKYSFFDFGDLIATAAPWALLLGRLGNFINAELYGQVSTVPWAVVFPGTDGRPRHPTQLYEATAEGLILGIVMYFLWARTSLRHSIGRLSGIFFVFYGAARFVIEYFRDNEAPGLGIHILSLTTGQVLCLMMVGIGIYWIWRPLARGVARDEPASNHC